MLYKKSPALVRGMAGRPIGRHRAVPGRRARQWLGLAVGLYGLLPPAHGAGGHHAVDDAAILEPGQCQLETWVDRERQGARTLVHLGPACRIGAVELGLNGDRTRATGLGSTTVAGPQLKWAHPLTDTLSAGVVLGINGRAGSPRVVTSTVVLPLTWQASPSVAMHLNVGKDLRRGSEPDTSRAGAALEWAPRPGWSFVAERFRESDLNHWRVGGRYELSESLSLDLSRARGLRGNPPAWWTLGLNWAFAH